MASRALLLCVLFVVGSPSRGGPGGGAGPVLTFRQEPPPEVVVARGRPANLSCSAPGRNISWLRDGAPLRLEGDSRRQLLPDGTLFFSKVVNKKYGGVNNSDQGEYRCAAHSDQGTYISRACKLRVTVIAQQFSKSPMNTTVEEDDVVRFMCQIESVPKAVISWEKDGELLPQDRRFLVVQPGLLYLSRVQFSDAGIYRCVAMNPMIKKLRPSSGAMLTVVPRSTVSRPIEFLSHGEPVTSLQGADVTLHCIASGFPNPVISWFHKGPPLHPVFQDVEDVSVVHIRNISVNQSGVYVCNATTMRSDGTLDWAAQDTSVDVLVPPKLTSVPMSQVSPAAKTARFNCTAEGHPPPNILWLKDGRKLRINGRIKQQAKQLVLSTTVTTDSGVYQCVASSKAGEAWAAGYLLVNVSRFQPPPPTGLTCKTRSSTEVLLSLDNMDHVPNFQAYTYHFLPTAGGPTKESVTPNRTVIVDKLKPYTNYTFFARVYTKTSASDLSKEVTCLTGEGVPLKSPKPQLVPKSPSTLLVCWSALPSNVSQGVITQYKIQWRLQNHPSVPTEFVNGNSLEYLISGLQPGSKYDVRVLAATSEGWSEIPDEQMSWSTVEMPSSSEKNVPLAPTVHLTVLSPTSIEVMWKLPPDNKYKPTRYSLYYRKRNDAQVGPVELPSTTTQYLLQDLDPETWYEVLVLGTSENEEGEAGVQSIVTLPLSQQFARSNSNLFLGQLLPPTSLVAEPISPTSINLTWTSSVNASYFTVCYAVVHATLPTNQSSYSYVRSTGNGVQVNDLRPHTLYEFKVRTHDQSDRYGPYSNTVECRTLEDVPGLVSNVQWKPVNHKTIHVKWKEPKYSNGIIKMYEVAITNDTDLPVGKWKLLEVLDGRSSTEVTDLSANSWYYLMVRAITRAGAGPYSPIISLYIPTGESVGTIAPNNPISPPESSSHQRIGVAVAVSSVAVAVVGVALCWYCKRSRRPPAGGHHVNGNGYCHSWQRRSRGHLSEGLHEMEYFSPAVATNIPPEHHSHLDTKGGYPNGQANGLKHSLLSNGRVRSGQVLDSRSFNITENPQFQNGDGIEKVDAFDDSAHSEPLLSSKVDEKCEIGEALSQLGQSSCSMLELEAKDLNTTQTTLLDIMQPQSLNGSSNCSSHHCNT